MAKDPICGMFVDESKPPFKSEYQGRMFYFCSSGCKNTFEKDPQRYAMRA